MLTLRTDITPAGVAYSVERDENILWHRLVLFGHDAAHRAGGWAFQNAAQDQERHGTRLAAPGEDVVETIRHHGGKSLETIPKGGR